MTTPRHHACLGDGCPHCAAYDADPERFAPAWLAIGGTHTARPARSVTGGCVHLGQPTGSTVECPSCNGKVMLKTFSCGVYGQCTVGKAVTGMACCGGRVERGRHVPCPSYAKELPSAQPVRSAGEAAKRPLVWSYGVTTVPGRIENGLLEKTLDSLDRGGFDQPRLFVDGGRKDSLYWKLQMRPNMRAVYHDEPLRTFGNWVISLWELYVREPRADRYAIFQDDMVCVTNLRGYLDRVHYPAKGYLNLYSFPQNEALANGRKGFYESNQRGRGAVALVFDREALFTVLTARNMLERVGQEAKGHKSVDGAVVTAMVNAGFKEYVHGPSLVQHTGLESSMGNRPHPLSETFPGEGFDAMKLLGTATQCG